MNCTKCGKEIPDGENTLCEECKKKEQEEKAEQKTEETVQKKEDSKNSKLMGIVIVLAIIAIMLLAYYLLTGKNKVGNTIGNIRNYGYSAKQGSWIYYLSPNEDSSKSGIFKVRANGSGKKELYMGEMDILSINVVGNYIYFIGIGSEEYSSEDSIDNKIYRMKTNGSDLKVINDNEFNNECYEIYVIGNSIYYIGVDANVYKMKLDGSNKEIAIENGTGYLGLTSKYIIYNKTESESTSDYVTYIANLDGSNERPIISGKRLYSVCIAGEYVYYTTDEKAVYRTKIGSNNEELLLEDTAYNLNCDGKYLYYLNYADMENEDYTVCIYRMKADGSTKEPERIKDLETYSSFLNVVGNQLIYMDGNDNAAFITMLKTDGKKENELYRLDYENYYNSLDNETEPNEPTPDVTNNESDINTTSDAENTAVN